MEENKKPLCVGTQGNNYYYSLEPHDINRINGLPEGCTVEVNLGNEIDLIGGNKLVLSSDLIINVIFIHDKFLSDGPLVE